MTEIDRIRERHWAMPARGGSDDIAELLAEIDKLAAALDRAAANNHSEGYHDPSTFRDCADKFCREATALLGRGAK